VDRGWEKACRCTVDAASAAAVVSVVSVDPDAARAVVPAVERRAVMSERPS